MLSYQEKSLTLSGASGPAGEPTLIKENSMIKKNGIEIIGEGLMARWPAERLLTVSGSFLDQLFNEIFQLF